MKKIVLFLIALFIASSAFTQEVESHKPMWRFCYKILTNRLERPNRDKRRMKKGVRIISRKHISSNQAYKLSLLFSEDEYRLGFIKGIYPRITDKSNSIVLIDGFQKFSYQTILWEFIQSENKKYGIEQTDISSFQEFVDMRDRKRDRQYDKLDDVEEDEEKNIQEEKEENLISENNEEAEDSSKETESKQERKQPEKNENSVFFPDAEAYTGKNKGCDDYMNDRAFQAFANTVSKFEEDKKKAVICMEHTHKYCFTTSQVMKLGAVIKNEASRYVFFKSAKEKVYDKDNFHHVKQLLTNEKYIHELD